MLRVQIHFLNALISATSLSTVTSRFFSVEKLDQLRTFLVKLSDSSALESVHRLHEQVFHHHSHKLNESVSPYHFRKCHSVHDLFLNCCT